ncbi:PnuC protein [Leptospira ognonensis]|uniref:PnuC protein n=1 Tax=Leptospira ognonensis TaxID=2484945 RepID=A0A4R9JZN2_9LEPT|nr:PnuC protein [Leptospira ognonensis]TGL57858.1 PnuC protein [Leptospira ognonensis]
MTDLFKYYALDWIAMMLSILAMILLGNKVKWGFTLFMLANITWILLGFLLLDSYAIVFGNIVFLITNTRGFLKWNS